MDPPPADGYNSILVVVDQGLSKGVIFVPCNKTLTSEDTARLLLENLLNDLDFRIKLFQTEDLNLHQKHSSNS